MTVACESQPLSEEAWLNIIPAWRIYVCLTNLYIFLFALNTVVKTDPVTFLQINPTNIAKHR